MTLSRAWCAAGRCRPSRQDLVALLRQQNRWMLDRDVRDLTGPLLTLHECALCRGGLRELEEGLSAVCTLGLAWRQNDGSPGAGSYHTPTDIWTTPGRTSRADVCLEWPNLCRRRHGEECLPPRRRHPPPSRSQWQALTEDGGPSSTLISSPMTRRTPCRPSVGPRSCRLRQPGPSVSVRSRSAMTDSGAHRPVRPGRAGGDHLAGAVGGHRLGQPEQPLGAAGGACSADRRKVLSGRVPSLRGRRAAGGEMSWGCAQTARHSAGSWLSHVPAGRWHSGMPLRMSNRLLCSTACGRDEGRTEQQR
jgi:hypothetical protein